jgi:hypothetical protein
MLLPPLPLVFGNFDEVLPILLLRDELLCLSNLTTFSVGAAEKGWIAMGTRPSSSKYSMGFIMYRSRTLCRSAILALSLLSKSKQSSL